MPYMTVLWRAIQPQFRSEAWKGGGTRPEQPLHFLSSSLPPSELGRVFLVPASSREKRSSLLVFSPAAETPRLARLCAWRQVGESQDTFFLWFRQAYEFNRVSAPVDRWLPIFLLQLWTGNTA